MDSNGPRFLVGVTGHMNLSPEDQATAKRAFEQILQWLTADPKSNEKIAGVESLGPPLGLQNAGLLVLTSLAPGTDQIAATVCLEQRLEILCPLPFPHSWDGDSTDPAAPVYRNATTFVRHDADDPKRQADYDSLVTEIGAGNLFHVKRMCDLGLTDEELRQKLLYDIHNEDERNRRYRAAGEYVASQCDLLVAICDRESPSALLPLQPEASPDTQPGANFVVEAKLRGITPGLLPEKSAINWADNGPVVRVFVRNQNRPRVEVSTSKSVPSPQMWHPEDSAPGYLESQDWHNHEMHQLRVFAEQLKKVQAYLVEGWSKPPAELTNEFLPTERRQPFIPNTVSQVVYEWIENSWQWWRLKQQVAPRQLCTVPPANRLEQIAAVYDVASRVAAKADRQMKRLRRLYLGAALTTVVMLQMAEQFGPHANDGDPIPMWLFVMRIVLTVLALVCLGDSIRRHVLATWNQTESIQNEFRALAEALRVQFYWSAAGTGEVISQHYLQRQRGELSWIRGVISSMLIPAEVDQQEFDGLKDEDKKRRFEKIHQGWIGEQRSYFETVSYCLENRKHWLHFWQVTLLCVGLLMTFSGMLTHVTDADEWLRKTTAFWGSWAPIHVFVATLVIFVVMQLVSFNTWKKLRNDCKSHHGNGGPDCGDKTASNENAGSSDIGYRERCCMPVRLSDSTKTCLRRHHMMNHLVGSTPFNVAFGLIIGIALISLSFSNGLREDWFSSPMKFNNFCRNICLTLAALCHAEASFSFLAQNVPRYQTMRGLFRGADFRRVILWNYLDRFNDETKDNAAFDSTVRDTQAFFVDLGVEALNENSEWLQMHRVTPTAPLIPAG